MKLNTYKTIYYKIDKNSVKSKIAIFDMDYTLIKPDKYSTDKKTWKFLYEEKTIEKLREINKYNQILIVIHKKELSNNNNLLNEISRKLLEIKKILGFNFDIIISTNNDYYKKPLTGIWDFYNLFRNTIIYKPRSFYVGNFAGRVYEYKKSNGTIKKDINNDDRFFAYNIGLKFYTPEEFFNIVDKKHKIIEPKLNIEKSKIINITSDRNIIILVGPPACGKTKFYQNNFNKYEHISLDNFNNLNACLKLTEYSMLYKKNIVIDNRNPDFKTRKNYLDLADKYDYNKYIINFNISQDINNYFNCYRVQKSKGKINFVTKNDFNNFYNNYDKPTEDEATIYNYSNYKFSKKYKF